MIIFLKDSTQAEPAKIAIRKVLAYRGAYPRSSGERVNPQPIVVKKGQCTGVELLAYSRALEGLKTDPDVLGIELDTEVTRLWLGLESGARAHRGTDSQWCAVHNGRTGIASAVPETNPLPRTNFHF